MDHPLNKLVELLFVREPIVRRLVEHDEKIVCHHIASASGAHSNLIQCQPLLGVGLAIVRVHPEDLEARGRPNGPQSCYEGAKASRCSVLGVILLPALDFLIVTCGSAILDAVMDVDGDIDVLMDVVR